MTYKFIIQNLGRLALMAAFILSTSNLEAQIRDSLLFVVAPSNSLKMTPKNHKILGAAAKSVFGGQIGYQRIAIERERRLWLTVYGTKGTAGIPLKIEGKHAVIDMGGRAVICSTTSSCDCCKVSCACSKKNGGQESCGSGNCDKSQSVAKVGQFAEVASSMGL